MSDGEFQEGQTWEAIAGPGRSRLDNVRVIVDVNGQQCDGPSGPSRPRPRRARAFEAFGASAVAVDGHDLDALDRP